jgi:hypothetical protein
LILHALVSLLALAPPTHPQAAALPSELALQPPSELRDAIELYSTDRRALMRRHSISMSEARHARLAEFYRAWAERLAVVDFDALGREGQVDHLLLAGRVRYEQRKLELDAVRRAETAPYLPFAATIVELEEARRRFEEIDPAALARTLHELAVAVDAAREALDEESESDDEEAGEAIEPDPLVLERAARGTDELKRALAGWFRFHDRYHPLFSWWVAAPHEEAEEALTKYAAALRKEAGVDEDDDDAIHGQPIGRDALLAELAYEMIPYTPEELIEIAEAEFAWCENEYRRAAAELGYGDDWKAALERGRRLPRAERPRHRAATVPRGVAHADDEPRAPEGDAVLHRRRDRHGRLPDRRHEPRGEADEPAWQQPALLARGGAPRADPGPPPAGLHVAALPRAPRRVPHAVPGRGLGAVLGTPAVGSRLRRDARGADRDRRGGVRVVRERVPPRRGRARLRRRLEGGVGGRWVSGGYGPLYQCAYMLGGIQLRGLRRELVDTGRMTDRAFHDAVLQQNAIPIELIRAALTGQELTRDFRSTWRFAD